MKDVPGSKLLSESLMRESISLAFLVPIRGFRTDPGILLSTLKNRRSKDDLAGQPPMARNDTLLKPDRRAWPVDRAGADDPHVQAAPRPRLQLLLRLHDLPAEHRLRGHGPFLPQREADGSAVRRLAADVGQGQTVFPGRGGDGEGQFDIAAASF